jgi:hypothetical protein
MKNIDPVCMSTRHKRSPGGSTGGGDMKVAEVYRFIAESIKRWSFDIGVTMASQVAIALVVGNDDDNIWFFCSLQVY